MKEPANSILLVRVPAQEAVDGRVLDRLEQDNKQN